MLSVVLLAFTSCKPKQEEMTFTFAEKEITANSVNVTVTPSDLERNYFLGILPSTDVENKDDAQIISEGSETFQKCIGEKSYGLDNLQPETDYVALAFACNDAEKVARYTMRTLEAPQDSVPEEPEEPEKPEDPETPIVPVPIVKLMADKTEIYNDGNDKVVFTVSVNEDVVTEGYQIINVKDSTAVTNNTFSSTEVGVYTFVAIYNKVSSTLVEIKVSQEPAPVVKLVADKTEIYNNGKDKVTFTVSVDDVVLTEGYQLLNAKDSTAVVDNVFTATELGTYTFVAIYNKVASNTVEVQVLQKPDPVVKLVADKSVIKNSGVDVVTFTVMVDGEDLTSESVIFNNTANADLDGNTFSSDKIGTYVFSATYEGFKSEDVTITVKEARVYSPGDLYDEDGVKGVVFYVDETGTSGYIMSMDEAYLEWSTENVWVNCLSGRGDWNTEDMLKLGADKYPAAKWCADHGEGWYMPSYNEMNLMWDAISNGKRDFDDEFVKLYNDKLDDPVVEDYYWTSNETSEDMAEFVAFIEKSVVCMDPWKSVKLNVRAVHKF